VANITEVYDLADAIEERYRLMVLLVTFCGLRLGELIALRRDRVDVLHRRVIVTEQGQELRDGSRHHGPSKTASCARWHSRHIWSATSKIISCAESDLGPPTCCSPGRMPPSCIGRHSTVRGTELGERSAWTASIFTTFVTPAARWLPRRGRARRS
jgi:hypothetical protein